MTGTCYSDLLHGAMPSNMTVTGFNSNDAPLQGEMFGTVYMHAVGIENEDAVGAYKMSMTTVPGLAFNLFPERSLYEQGYTEFVPCAHILGKHDKLARNCNTGASRAASLRVYSEWKTRNSNTTY
eukprot:COSAG02_NODE_5_length_66751_cov_63.939148_50_plen_125_part_00